MSYRIYGKIFYSHILLDSLLNSEKFNLMLTSTVKIKQFFTEYSLDVKWWNVYFFIKIYLFYSGVIDFNFWYNTALFFYITISAKLISIRFLSNLFIGLLAVSLLYYDSYLPPFSGLINQINTILEFDKKYIFELVNRFININYAFAILGVCLAYSIARKYLRITVIIFLTIVYIALSQKTTRVAQAIEASNDSNIATQSIDYQLNAFKQDFFSQQSKKQAHLAVDNHDTENFDILFISVCSLSRDDLNLAGLENHRLFERFDISFSHYNSATSYSGPALVRLLRAGCGQTTHAELFKPAKHQACYLFENLQRLGFSTDIAMNHNGAFDNFSQLVQENAQIDHPIKHYDELSPYQVAFDGSPVQRDVEVLDNLISDSSSDSHTNSSILLYNTISLHDGNRIVNSDNSSSLVSYKKRLQNLLDDLDAIYQKIELSGRNIVLVFIPEHGSGLRGDKVQIAGIREIPSPAIVNIPVGITLYGAALSKKFERLTINQPSSHLALGQFISNIIDTNAFGNHDIDIELLTANLPHTPIVAQNAGVTMIVKEDDSYITLDDLTWNLYPTEKE
jgi:cellulose synthase operon protein YhjU